MDCGENCDEPHTVKLLGGRCPECGAELETGAIRPVGAFPCPQCKTPLQVSEDFFSLAIWAFVALVVVASYLAGLRGLRLVAVGVFVFIPIAFIVVNFSKYLISPTIERYVPKTSTLDLRK